MIDRLMAYVDGELDDAARRAFEAEMAANPGLATQAAAQRALRARLSAAYGPVLEEVVPLRLDLAARAANDPARAPRAAVWAAMAASLVVGVLAGRFALAPEPPVTVGADLPARTELARALDRQLAAEAGVVRIGLTFRNAQGRVCRTFQSEADGLAGMACRGAEGWRVTTTTAWSPPVEPQYRTAASATPPEVLAAVDRARAGETFDPQQERAARDGGWR